MDDKLETNQQLLNEKNVTTNEEAIQQTIFHSDNNESDNNESDNTNSETSEQVQYFLQSLDGIEKDLNCIIEEMQQDLEQIFGELINSIINHAQSRISCIHSKINIIDEKIKERKEIASNLQKAGIAIQSFYQSVDEQHDMNTYIKILIGLDYFKEPYRDHHY